MEQGRSFFEYGADCAFSLPPYPVFGLSY